MCRISEQIKRRGSSSTLPLHKANARLICSLNGSKGICFYPGQELQGTDGAKPPTSSGPMAEQEFPVALGDSSALSEREDVCVEDRYRSQDRLMLHTTEGSGASSSPPFSGRPASERSRFSSGARSVMFYAVVESALGADGAGAAGSAAAED
jgi:hypothetical protein